MRMENKSDAVRDDGIKLGRVKSSVNMRSRTHHILLVYIGSMKRKKNNK